MTPNLTLHVSWTRPGGGYRWCLDLADRQLQLGPVLFTCLPASPPLIDRLELARTTQQSGGPEVTGWAVDWTGVAIRPLGGLVVSVRYGTAVSRWLRSWDGRRQRRAQRTRERQRGHYDDPPLGLVALVEHDDGLHAATIEVAPTGYVEGGVLSVGDLPWGVGWERRRQWETCKVWDQSARDGEGLWVPADFHAWERVVVQSHGDAIPEAVVRCARCHVPRCGSSTKIDPCMLRRHHHVDPGLPWDGHLPLSTMSEEA